MQSTNLIEPKDRTILNQICSQTWASSDSPDIWTFGLRNRTMPLALRGKLKDKIEIYWNGKLESIVICPQRDKTKILFFFETGNKDNLQIQLSDLDFSNITTSELSIVAIANDDLSSPLKIQKCPHSDCSLWGHSKEDGYCKHCGRKIRQHRYTMGFPKLEMTQSNVTLWNGKQGVLWKSKEQYEHESLVYSVGQYQIENNESSKKSVDILEEKFSENTVTKFKHLYQMLENSDLLDKYWHPPFMCPQKEHQRTLWIYYNQENNEAPCISAYNYIMSKVNEPLSTREIVSIGLQLCRIAMTIHSYNQSWCSLRMVDLFLQRKSNGKYPISIFLQSKDIAWQENNSQRLLDNSLVPWELYWDNSNNPINQSAEVYVIAATLYLLKAKSPNLLHYNPISCQHGLPGLKLFRPDFTENVPKKDNLNQYFESVINQALISHPEERGYQKIVDLHAALESLWYIEETKSDDTRFLLDVGSDLDVGDEKCIDDFTENQDSLFLSKNSLAKKGWGIFVLCDGISTANIGTGADASKIVTDTFKAWWQEHSPEEQEKVCLLAKENLPEARKLLTRLVSIANKKIHDQVVLSKGNPERDYIMGTTISVGIFYQNILFFAWVGDSPVYRFSQFGWERLNYEDNERNSKLLAGLSLDEAFTENGNAITRCVGANYHQEEHIHLHFDYTYLNAGESILICSDGVSDFIEPETDFASQENYRMMRLASIFAAYDNDPLINAKALASILISCGNRIGGGKDNLSAIILRTIPKTINLPSESYNRLRLMSFIRQKKLQRANDDENARITRRLSITQDID